MHHFNPDKYYIEGIVNLLILIGVTVSDFEPKHSTVLSNYER